MNGTGQIDVVLDRLLRHGLIAKADDASLYVADEVVRGSQGTANPWVVSFLGSTGLSALAFARPASPFQDILRELTRSRPPVITPEDGETVLFLHDIPVVRAGDAAGLERALVSRKGCLIRGTGPDSDDVSIAAGGALTLEQAFVSISSICFSTSVKYLRDALAGPTGNFRAILDRMAPLDAPESLPPLGTGSPAEVRAALAACGRTTVEARLVDSYFGNLSFSDGKTLYISQTGSSLDALEGCIDPVPLDGGSTAGLTASSETGAHIAIVRDAGARAVLHGHPRFSVVLSMFCAEKAGCPPGTRCARDCPVTRFAVEGVPIVPGEVGMGPFGLVRTVPPAIARHGAAIVHGHGTFVGASTLSDAFERLRRIEIDCYRHYRELAGA
ncbi:MAG TPA: class II aldolase/adducin family protein [Candidatus Deferrimicrobiaceae bacterium]|jgi:ribulose-5-phosphate 4-epimerase/fuculose-1-phosphate aldolase